MHTWSRLFYGIEKRLEGWPDSLLTVSLLAAAVILVFVALRATRVEKALALAYVILP